MSRTAPPALRQRTRGGPIPASAGTAATSPGVQRAAPLQRTCPCGGGCPACRAGWAIGRRDDPAEAAATTLAHRLQRAAAGDAAGPPLRPLAAPALPLPLADRGTALPPHLRLDYERGAGIDLSPVRVHAGPAAAAAAQDVGARAWTAGHDIVLGPAADTAVLAHEVAHLVTEHAPGRQAAAVLRRAPLPGPQAAPPFPAEDLFASGMPDGGRIAWEQLLLSWRLLARDPAASSAALPPLSLGIAGVDPEQAPQSRPQERLAAALEEIRDLQSLWGGSDDVDWAAATGPYADAAHALFDEAERLQDVADGRVDPLAEVYARVFPDRAAGAHLTTDQRMRLAVRLADVSLPSSTFEALQETVQNPLTWAALAAFIAFPGAAEVMFPVLLGMDLALANGAWLELRRTSEAATDEDSLREAGNEYLRAAGGTAVTMMLIIAGTVAGEAAGPRLRALKESLNPKRPPAASSDMPSKLPATFGEAGSAESSAAVSPAVAQAAARAARPSHAAAGSALDTLVAPGVRGPLTRAEAAQWLKEAYPDLRIVTDPNPMLSPKVDGMVIFVDIQGGRPAVVLAVKRDVSRVTLQHESLHVDDFVAGRLPAPYRVPAAQATDDLIVAATRGEGMRLTQGDIANSQLAEIVNHLRDATRLGSPQSIANATDYIVRLEGHLHALLGDCSVATVARARPLREDVHVLWHDAGLAPMLEVAAQNVEVGATLVSTLRESPWTATVLGDLLPVAMRPPDLPAMPTASPPFVAPAPLDNDEL